ncbi:hypothetical protein MBLNU13_g02380t1 [Cladosporium sp. NU13]
MSEAESAAPNDHATSQAFGTDDSCYSCWKAIGCVVAPAFTGIDLCGDARRIIRSGAPGPRYVNDGTMRINPAINSSAAAAPFFDGVVFIRKSIEYLDKLLPLMGITVVLESIQDSSELSSKRHEFVTSLPITMIMLGSRSQLSDVPEVNDHTSAAILRENTGIRISHLLDLFEKMNAYALQTHHQDLRWPEPAASSPVRVETNFETQRTCLPCWMNSEDQGDNESNTRDGGDDETDGSGGDEHNNSGEGGDEVSSEDDSDSDMGLVPVQSEDHSEDSEKSDDSNDRKNSDGAKNSNNDDTSSDNGKGDDDSNVITAH